MSESFLNDRVTLHCGDCRDVLASLEENSVDSCVTDPPYHLTSIVRRFGNECGLRDTKTSLRARAGIDPHSRTSRGFMGRTWDGGDIAFKPELWAAVYRVLKPGAHLLAFGGTRTYHRMACAIEDAGFEIRDCVQWLYGSGFPKSHDVSKSLDGVLGKQAKGFKFKGGDLPTNGGSAFRSDHPDYKPYEPATAAARQWEGWGTALKPACELIVLARKPLSEGTVAANVLKWGTGAINVSACRVSVQRDVDDRSVERNNACTSHEHIGGQNTSIQNIEHRQTSEQQRVDHGCRLASEASNDQNDHGPLDSPTDCPTYSHSDDEQFRLDVDRAPDGAALSGGVDKSPAPESARKYTHACPSNSYPTHNIDVQKTQYIPNGKNNVYGKNMGGGDWNQSTGRWPANFIHDGSEEVVGAFPETGSSSSPLKSDGTRSQRVGNDGWDRPWKHGEQRTEPTCAFNDSGSAARFFYTAKADSDDRLGSKHPTVKPLDLMQYLVRLITPRGGTCLDLFAGTGTTGEAAYREGMRAVLIEREEEYCADIRRRMQLVLSGPDERARESIKAKNLPYDPGPLFDNYNAEKDFGDSINECYADIRERVAKGGPGWGGWPE